MDVAKSLDGTLRVEGTWRRFRVPQLAAGAQGPAKLEVTGGTSLFHPRVTRCEGFAKCRFDYDSALGYKASVPVTVHAQ